MSHHYRCRRKHGSKLPVRLKTEKGQKKGRIFVSIHRASWLCSTCGKIRQQGGNAIKLHYKEKKGGHQVWSRTKTDIVACNCQRNFHEARLVACPCFWLNGGWFVLSDCTKKGNVGKREEDRIWQERRRKHGVLKIVSRTFPVLKEVH